jgi:methionyl-tRNA formyltransferase
VVAVVTDDHQETSPTANTARKFGLNLLDYDSFIKDIDSSSLKFDLVVSYVYWKILKKPLIQAPRLGILNFHPAPLPDLRGVGGFNLAILENHKTFGVTVHYMDEGIDTGPVIEVDRFSIDAKSETAQSLEKKSHKRMVELFKKTLNRVKKEGILPSKTMTGGRHLSRQEMEELKNIQPEDDVDAKIRAFWFPPYDGAYVEINGKKYTLVNRGILEQIDGDPEALFRHTQKGS